MTRRWLTFVEIDVSVCSLSYGVAPCVAAVPTTGSQKCFNSIGSCQDRANYAEAFVTLRFTKDSGYQAESGIEAIPSLVDADLDPGEISLGVNLGRRPEVTCSFTDHPHSDTGAGFDKYLSTRAYDPFKQGTFWAKFAQRHPNLRGKKLRVIQGYLGQSLAEMETRHYQIDTTELIDGGFRISAMDPLRSLDGDQAQAPALSTGFLSGGINSSVGSATLAPGGVGNAEYPGSGYLNIGGKEIVSFARTGDALTITRGQQGTTGVAHAAGDRVQLCLDYTAQDPADIIEDLFTTYGGIDAAYVPLDDWKAETAAYNGQVYTGFIAEPTPVRDLVSEIIEQAGLAVWWDEVAETHRLQVLRQISADAVVFDESIYAENSFRCTPQPDKRFSSIWTYFAQRNPLEPDDLSNYQGAAALDNTDAAADYGYKLKDPPIVSRWIPSGGRVIAERLNEIQLGRYLKPPRKFEFDLIEADGTVLPELGGGYLIAAPTLQDASGARVNVPFQVTRLKKKDGRVYVTGEEVNWTDLAQASDPFNRIITVDYNSYNLTIRTLHDALYGTPTAGGTVTFILASTARIGSTSTSVAALETGTWPSVAFTGTRTNGNATLTSIADTTAFVVGQAVTGTGIQNDSRVVSKTVNSVTLDKTVTGNGATALTLWTTILNVVINGQVIGKGGNGGNGKGGNDNPGDNGEHGGTGLKATAPINVSGTGKVDGGGGGGGGAGGDYRGWLGPQVYGGGGGGGAGDVPGGGGAKGGGSAAVGQPGTLNAGGAYGTSAYADFRGGTGGLPGAAGGNAVGDYRGLGGAAGKSVEGDAFVKDSAFTGVYRGPKT